MPTPDKTMIARSLLLLASLAAAPVLAGTDAATLYDVSTEGTTQKLKAGESGRMIIAILTKDGAHVSDEAPLRIELSSRQSRLAKERLTLADAVAGQKGHSPRFEVAFTPTTQGPTSLEAKLTFFVCTETLCARQTRTLSVPVTVE